MKTSVLAGCRHNCASRHSGAMRSIEPGISRFRVWSFGPSRNDDLWIASLVLAMTVSRRAKFPAVIAREGGRSSITETSMMESRSRSVLDTRLRGYDGSLRGNTSCHSSPHSSLALENANDDTRRVFSSKISVRVIGGSARWLQFSRSQSRQLTPIGVPSAFSRSIPVA